MRRVRRLGSALRQPAISADSTTKARAVSGADPGSSAETLNSGRPRQRCGFIRWVLAQGGGSVCARRPGHTLEGRPHMRTAIMEVASSKRSVNIELRYY